MRGKIIVIEGTDCSGKETQTSLLVQRLKREGKKVETNVFVYLSKAAVLS